MSRQYFADTLTEPVNAAYTTITATTETVLIPTALTGIPANEPRAGKVYQLIVGGTCTTGTAGTLIITPRYGLVIGGTSLTASPTQNYVPSITTAPFLYECYLVIRSIGLPGANSTVMANGTWTSGGAVATAASVTEVLHSPGRDLGRYLGRVRLVDRRDLQRCAIRYSAVAHLAVAQLAG